MCQYAWLQVCPRFRFRVCDKAVGREVPCWHLLPGLVKAAGVHSLSAWLHNAQPANGPQGLRCGTGACSVRYACLPFVCGCMSCCMYALMPVGIVREGQEYQAGCCLHALTTTRTGHQPSMKTSKDAILARQAVYFQMYCCILPASAMHFRCAMCHRSAGGGLLPEGSQPGCSLPKGPVSHY